MREDGGVTAVLRERNGVERFGERTNLVHLHENRVRRAGVDALLEELHVGDKYTRLRVRRVIIVESSRTEIVFRIRDRA